MAKYLSEPLKKVICVWQDPFYSEDGRKWIVSRDGLDDGNRAEWSDTLHVVATEDEAMELGREEASKRGLPLYRNHDDGVAELL
ncbi:MAG TPA: hypothetical protein VKE98_20760 [Gemmataceae bacterium]|nr:hypothetical protein [Gemmataceae bacterium]